MMPMRRSLTSGFEALPAAALDEGEACAAAGAASDLLHAGSASAAGSSALALSTSRLPKVVITYLLENIKTPLADRAARSCTCSSSSDRRAASRTRHLDET